MQPHIRRSLYFSVLLLALLLTCGHLISSIAYGSTGGITGRVTDASGTPMSGVYAYLYTSSGSFLTLQSTDSSGNYTFTGFASGAYKVLFDKTGYSDVWYNGASSEATATLITVTSPYVTSGVNGVMGVGGKITGRVTDASGTSMSGVYANLYASSGSFLTLQSTDSSGNYTFTGLASGTYKVLFDKPGYSDVWYNGASSEATATLITVTSPYVTSGVNGVMGGNQTCTYALSPGSEVFAATSALGVVTVTPSSSSCSWTVTCNASWVAITAGSSGTGNGTVSYSVSANATGSNRTGTMTIGEHTFIITQSCAYLLTVSAIGNGTITSSPTGISCENDCTENYLSGTSVTLTATPASGSNFTGWSGACSGIGSCQVTMSQARNVTATFDIEKSNGDVNGDGDITLADAILSLQVISGKTSAQAVNKAADVNGDGIIGIAEVIYILQKAAGAR